MIEVRHLLRQTGFPAPLNFFFVALAVYNLVDMHAVALEKGADIPLLTKGRGIDPDLKASFLKFMD